MILFYPYSWLLIFLLILAILKGWTFSPLGWGKIAPKIWEILYKICNWMTSVLFHFMSSSIRHAYENLIHVAVLVQIVELSIRTPCMLLFDSYRIGKKNYDRNWNWKEIDSGNRFKILLLFPITIFHRKCVWEETWDKS